MSSHDDYAKARAQLLLGCYRTIGASDLPRYIMGLQLILALFPEPVIAEATSPQTGIQTRLTWPPNPAELRSYCEAIALRNQRIAAAKPPNPIAEASRPARIRAANEAVGFPLDFLPKPYSKYWIPGLHDEAPRPVADDPTRVLAALERYKAALKPMETPKRSPWQPPSDDDLYARYGRREPSEQPVPFD